MNTKTKSSIWLRLLIFAFAFFYVTMATYAGDPGAPPPPGGSPGGSDPPVGGGAPVDAGFMVFLIPVLLYLAFSYRKWLFQQFNNLFHV